MSVSKEATLAMLNLIRNCGSIAIIGMDKNVGKTTVLNHIISKTEDTKILGLTSIGRDGESQDRVTKTYKPQIYVRKNTIIGTSRQCLEQSDITKEILETTDMNTPMGRIIIIRALSDGFVEIAGPSVTEQMKIIVKKLKKWGADLILVDGAISRMTQCSPSIVDEAILCTGASLSKNMIEVTKKTSHVVKMLTLSKIQDTYILDYIRENEDKRALFFYENKILNLDCKTALELSEKIQDYIDDDLKAISIKGVLSENLCKKIVSIKNTKKTIDLIIEDGTKSFISEEIFEQLSRNNVQLYVKDEIAMNLLCYNPYSYDGYLFDNNEFKMLLEKEIPLKIVNVLEGA